MTQTWLSHLMSEHFRNIVGIKSDSSIAGWQDTIAARADACCDGGATQGCLRSIADA